VQRRAAPRRFAEGTSVDVTKSRMEVEQLLAKHGAAQVLIGSDAALRQGFVAFTLLGRQYRLLVPAREAKRGKEQQVDRERWRALVLILKAKLEVVASGMVTMEQEFLAYMVLPNGSTVGAEIAPRLAEAYDTGKMPNLLLPA
jgi:hypothetical protein